MQAKPISAVIKGVNITDLFSFRYGTRVMEQQFFELKFRQPLFGSPFSFGLDNPENYNNEAITLYFEDSFGKQKSVSATIVKLEFIQSPGQQPEVFISGTMYRPSGNISKFVLSIIALLALPFLLTGSLYLYISHLSSNLVKIEGTVNSYQNHSYKGIKKYTFKIEPYKSKIYREYYRPFFSSASTHINALFKTNDGGTKSDSTGQHVKFYVFRTDQDKLNSPTEKVDFFYLQARSQQLSKFDYYYDVLVYTTNQTWFYFVWIFYMLLEVFCFGCAYFCYKMYQLDQQLKNRIAWWTVLLFGSVINAAVLLIII